MVERTWLCNFTVFRTSECSSSSLEMSLIPLHCHLCAFSVWNFIRTRLELLRKMPANVAYHYRNGLWNHLLFHCCRLPSIIQHVLIEFSSKSCGIHASIFHASVSRGAHTTDDLTRHIFFCFLVFIHFGFHGGCPWFCLTK